MSKPEDISVFIEPKENLGNAVDAIHRISETWFRQDCVIRKLTATLVKLPDTPHWKDKEIREEILKRYFGGHNPEHSLMYIIEVYHTRKG